jgi:hypothetical protein
MWMLHSLFLTVFVRIQSHRGDVHSVGGYWLKYLSLCIGRAKQKILSHMPENKERFFDSLEK